jgi:glycosyltransferase involved in cell wall biosynthesis
MAATLKGKNKDRLLIVAPLPPPMGGVEHAMEQLLGSSLTQRFSTTHVNSRIRCSNKQRGYIDFSGMKNLLALCFKILRSIILTRPTLVYCPMSSNKTGFARDAVLILLARITGRKIVVHYMGGNFDNFYRHSTWLGKILIRFVLRLVDALIVLGESIKRNFKGIYPESKEIKVVPNGMNPNQFIHRSSFPNHKAESSFQILYIGNISFVKGFYDLMIVYKRLFEKFPSLRLSFVGEIISVEQEKNILRKYFSGENQKRMDGSSKEIDEFVQEAAKYHAAYLGVIDGDRKLKVLSEAAVFVLPSYSEGLSTGVLEAMAAGLPVITTKVGAMSEVILDGENGYLVEPGDCETLYEKLAALINNRELCKKMGKRSVEIVKERFDIERVAEHLGDIFDSIIRVKRVRS